MGQAAPPLRFVVTGPSGWIGRALLAHIGRRFGRVADVVTAFASSDRDMDLPLGGTLRVRALEGITPADVAGANVVHLAYLTKEKAEQLGERRFTDTNLAIDDALLAAMASAPPASLFVASSGAAKLAATGDDLHPYGVGKLRQEARFLAAAAAGGYPAIAGRIFNIAGPWMNKLDSYALSNMLVQALDTGRIGIQARVPVFRSYLHVDDLCAIIVGAAVRGTTRASAVDLCGAEVVEMGDLAAAVNSALAEDTQIERGRVDYTQASTYLGDFTATKTLAMELGLELQSLTNQVADTLAWIKIHAGTDKVELSGA